MPVIFLNPPLTYELGAIRISDETLRRTKENSQKIKINFGPYRATQTKGGVEKECEKN